MPVSSSLIDSCFISRYQGVFTLRLNGRFGDEPGNATETWVRQKRLFKRTYKRNLGSTKPFYFPLEECRRPCRKLNLGSELSGGARPLRWMYRAPLDLNLRDVDKHRDGAKIVVPKWEGHIEPS